MTQKLAADISIYEKVDWVFVNSFSKYGEIKVLHTSYKLYENNDTWIKTDFRKSIEILVNCRIPDWLYIKTDRYYEIYACLPIYGFNNNVRYYEVYGR